MIALLRNTRFQVAMMLWTSVMALDDACCGNSLVATAMIVCSLFWMIQVWGGLREKSEP